VFIRLLDTEQRSEEQIVAKFGEDFIIMTFVVSLHNVGAASEQGVDEEILKDNLKVNKSSESNLLQGILYFYNLVNSKLFYGTYLFTSGFIVANTCMCTIRKKHCTGVYWSG